MTENEIITGLASGKIKRVKDGICPVCGDEFKSTHHHGKLSCAKNECSSAIRRCSIKAANVHDFTPEKAKRDAINAGNLCASMIDPWLANYGGVWVNADPVLGF